jgi:hypothetical protein
MKTECNPVLLKYPTEENEAKRSCYPIDSMALRATLCLSLVLLLLPAVVLIPRLGVQGDEALFAAGVYPGISIEYRPGGVPVMLMSYVGALKSWLYTPLFALWKPSVWSLRIPVVLLAGLSVVLFAFVMDRMFGWVAACAGALLLATDPEFLLMSTFDWGPVVLQMLLALGAALLIVKQRPVWASLLLGLAVWNKAVFVWFLAPALLLLAWVIPRRKWIPCFLAFAAGCAPLLLYNLTGEGRTFRDNAHFSTGYLDYKASMVRDTLDGSSLFGYLVAEGDSVLLRRTLTALAAIIAFATLALRSKRRRLVLLSAGWFLASWLLMCLSGGGWASHHIVLLWPVPHLLIALAVADLYQWRPKLALTLTAILVVSALAVSARYVQLAYARPGPLWSPAIVPLAGELTATPASTPVIAGDWGIAHPVLLLTEGRVAPSFPGSTPLTPGTLWLTRPDGHEVQSGANERLREAAAAQGLRVKLRSDFRDFWILRLDR